MAIDTIKSSAVLDGAIATADIADDAVTSAKLDTNIAIAGNLLVGSSSAVGNTNANDLELTNSGGSGVVGMTLNVNSGSANTGNIYWRSNAANNNIQIAGDPISNYLAFATSGAEKMRLDSSGNLLIGKTADNVSTVGIEARATGPLISTRDGSDALRLNRLNSDGEIIQLRKDGTTVGSIGALGGRMFAGSGDVGVFFDSTNNMITPYSTDAGDTVDNTIDLGYSSRRFKNLYLSGGVFLGGVGSANYLSDYEEGTWTPQIWKNTTQVTSPTAAHGQYRKIGDVIFYSFYFYKSSGSNTDNNAWELKGLPFSMETAAASGYTSLTAGYTGINSVNYFDQAGSHRWQNNASSGFTLYGPQQNTQWSSGYLEFAGYGFVYAA